MESKTALNYLKICCDEKLLFNKYNTFVNDLVDIIESDLKRIKRLNDVIIHLKSFFKLLLDNQIDINLIVSSQNVNVYNRLSSSHLKENTYNLIKQYIITIMKG